MAENFERWIGRTRTTEDVVTRAPMAKLAAILDLPGPVDDVPPLWHWLFAHPAVPHSSLGPDGHERLGLFLPEIADSVRMWAGSRIDFHRPLRLGDRIVLTSRVVAVTPKPGRRGNLVFVELEHDYRVDEETCVLDRQSLVYRRSMGPVAGAPTVRSPPSPAQQDGKAFRLSDLQLLRYSAVTFNAHRIHFDRRYCFEEFGDQRLIVHGPLLATILSRVIEEKSGRKLAHLEFRLLNPIREEEPFFVTVHDPASDGSLEAAIVREDGAICLASTARLIS